MPSVLRGSDNFDTAISGKVLQVAFQSWNTQSSNNTVNYVRVIDSILGIIPKSSTSRLIVEANISVDVYKAPGLRAGGVGLAIEDVNTLTLYDQPVNALSGYVTTDTATNDNSYYSIYPLAVDIGSRPAGVLQEVGVSMSSYLGNATCTACPAAVFSNIKITEVEV